MPYFHFLWTNSLAEHLLEHGVEREDFEEVVNRPERRGQSRSSGHPCCWGETSDGRYLLCVYEYFDEMFIIPVTAYEVRRTSR